MQCDAVRGVWCSAVCRERSRVDLSIERRGDVLKSAFRAQTGLFEHENGTIDVLER